MIMWLKEKIIKIILPDYTKKHWEFYENILEKKGGVLLQRILLLKIQKYYGASIPVNKEINRFTTPHQLYGIFISSGAVIGENCVIFHHTTIGSNTLSDSTNQGAPQLGNNVYVGVGAKIIGNVKIGDNVRIGANCIVVEDIPSNATVVMEKPRVIIKNYERVNNFIPWKEATGNNSLR